MNERLQALLRYAETDASASGLSMSDSVTPESLADFLAKAGDVLFLHGDPNLDNMKRNLAVQVFLTFSMSEIIAFGSAWLEKWKQNEGALWHQEWVAIIERADSKEIADILLSHDEERVRQRLSMPFAEMLDFSVVLNVKRRYRIEEV